MIQAVNYSTYFGSFIQSFCYLMLSILHEIYIIEAPYLTPDTHFCQLQTWLFPAKSLYIQSYQNQAFKTYTRQAQSPLAYPSLAFVIQPLPWLSNEEADILSQGEEADCIQPASQSHHQLWCSKVVNLTLQQVDHLQISQIT